MRDQEDVPKKLEIAPEFMNVMFTEEFVSFLEEQKEDHTSFSSDYCKNESQEQDVTIGYFFQARLEKHRENKQKQDDKGCCC